ncbi:hypothetical protein QFC22_002720 [Naganishia vaughanmartiniae]|uniref:Uncharacterized protein n=1 Tax=Naganishia vaughanmartiniae TaxID=1424756 RepID=A0ACC2XA33_9TREE|nr:hypothetical protein QFC22_002720 [Naganishia vaughanmartiniae]
MSQVSMAPTQTSHLSEPGSYSSSFPLSNKDDVATIPESAKMPPPVAPATSLTPPQVEGPQGAPQTVTPGPPAPATSQPTITGFQGVQPMAVSPLSPHPASPAAASTPSSAMGSWGDTDG